MDVLTYWCVDVVHLVPEISLAVEPVDFLVSLLDHVLVDVDGLGILQ